MTITEMSEIGIKTGYTTEQIAQFEVERRRDDELNFETAKRTKKWFGYLFLAISDAERPAAFERCAPYLTDREYWQLLNDVWTGYDAMLVFHPTPYHVWDRLFTADRPQRKHLMSAAERKHLKSLPEWITVYRGCRLGFELEMSWTLSRDVARTFAQRQADFLKVDTVVVSSEVHKDDVYAYLDERKEAEIVWQPSLMTEYEVLEELKANAGMQVYLTTKK